ncbi:MAG: fibronectin type III domain-containing protein [Elusimicrobiota bacterium]
MKRWNMLKKFYSTLFAGLLLLLCANAKLYAAAPAQVTGLDVVAISSTTINLTWSIMADATFYDIHDAVGDAILAHIEGNTSYWFEGLVSETTNWYETGLSSNTEYSRYIRAGNGEFGKGPASVNISSYTLAYPPTTLTASATSTTKIDLTWNYSGATAYWVIYTTYTPLTNWGYEGIVPGDITSYTKDPVITGATYWFSIVPQNGDAIWDYDYDFPLASTRTVPGAIAYFSTSAVTANSITWEWATAIGADGYIVYCSSDDSMLQALGSGTTFWTSGALSPSAQYGRYVRALNNMGLGASSPQATFYALPNPPAYYPLTTSDVANAGMMTLKWSSNGNPVGNSTIYDIEASSTAYGSTVSTSAYSYSAYIVTFGSRTFSPLLANNTYWFRGRAMNPDGQYSDWANIVATMTLTGNPTKGMPWVSTGTFTAGWTKSGADPDYTEYRCELSVTPPWTSFTAFKDSGWLVNTTYYQFTELTGNTTYYARTYIRNGLGRLSSQSPVLISSMATNSTTPILTDVNPLVFYRYLEVWQNQDNGNAADTLVDVYYSADSFTTEYSTYNWGGFQSPFGSVSINDNGSFFVYDTTYSIKLRAKGKNGTYSSYSNVLSTYIPSVVRWTGAEGDNDPGNVFNWSPAWSALDGGNDDCTGLTVLFAGTTQHCDWNNVYGATVTAIVMEQGYTGTVDFKGNTYVLGDFTVSAGTFTVTGGTVTINGDISNSGAEGTVRFNASGGKIRLGGTVGSVITVSGNALFGDLEVNQPTGNTIFSASARVLGNYTYIDGTPSLGSNTLYVGGNVTCSVGHPQGIIELNGAGVQSLYLTGANNGNIVINSQGTVTAAQGATISTMTISQGIFNGGGYTLEIRNYLNVTGGTLNPAGGLLNLASGPGTVNCNSNLNNVTVQSGAWTITSTSAVSGNLRVDAGSLTFANPGGMNLISGKTDVAADAALTVNRSTCVFINPVTVYPSGALNLNSAWACMANSSSMTIYGLMVSTGDTAADDWSYITSTAADMYYRFGVFAGTVSANHTAFYNLDTNGIFIASDSRMTMFDDISIAATKAGITGLNYLPNYGTLTFSGVYFGAGLGQNVNAPSLAWPNYMNLPGSSGPMSGFGNENGGDPNNTIFWMVPTAPTITQSNSLSSSVLGWDWATGDDAVLYRVYLATDMATNASGDMVSTLAAPATYWAKTTGLTPDATCQVYVVAYNPLGVSTSTISQQVYTRAAVPTNLHSIEVTSHSINVEWDTTNPGTVGYVVKYSTTPNDNVTCIYKDTSTAVTSSLTTLLPYTTYYIAVRAINSQDVGTNFSSEYAVRTLIVTPPAATGFDGLALSTSSIRWIWNLASGATYYDVYSSTGGDKYVRLDETMYDNTSSTAIWVETDLNANQQYARYVVAGNVTGDSPVSGTASKYTWASVPGTISLTAGPTSIQIDWLTSGASWYQIWRSATGDVPWVFRSSATADLATYTDTGLSGETTYWYKLGAANGEGISNSAFSAVSSSTTLPAGPTGTSAVAMTQNVIEWQWSTGTVTSSIIGYRVYSSTGGVTLSGNLSKITTFWQESGITANAQRSRVVRAFNETGEGADSSVMTKYSLAAPPGDLGFTSMASATEINLGWTASSATQYRVERSLDGASYVWVSSIAAITYSDAGRTSDTTYWYRIGAINGDYILNSAQYSNVVTTITLPAAPSGFAGSACTNATSIMWTWSTGTATSNIYGYKIYASSDSSLLWTLDKATSAQIEINLSTNTQYARTIKSYNLSGVSNGASASRYTYATAPAAVDIGTVGSTSVGISWTTSGVYQYKIERSTWGGANSYVFVSSAAAAATSYPNTGLSPDSTYWYRIGAINGDLIQTPGVYSTASSTITLPAAPAGLVGYAISVSTIGWYWTEGSSNIMGYKVYTSTNGLLTTLPKPTSSWFDTNLSTNTQYGRIFKSYNSAGESDGATAPKYTLAVAPTSLVISTSTMHSITMAWTGNGCSKYRVDRSLDGENGWTTIVGPSSNLMAATYKNENLALAKTYYYAVFGYNGNGVITSSTTPKSGTTATLPTTVTLLVTTSTVTQEQTKTAGTGEVKIEIPPGAITEDGYIYINVDAEDAPTEVTKTELDSATSDLVLDNNKLIAGSVIEINLFSLTGSTITGNFAKAFTLTMSYPDADNDDVVDNTTPPIRADALRIFTLNKVTLKWEKVSETVTLDKTNKKVSVEITHFSIYALVSVSTYESNLDKVIVYPNPYKPGSGGAFDNTSLGTGVLFDKLTQKANIKIFNIAGELVAECDETNGDGKYLWNICNADGEKVASGVYIYLVTNPDDSSQKTKGKFAIIK